MEDKEMECLKLLQKKLNRNSDIQFFGCSNEEKIKLKKIFLESKRNSQSNNFPDLVFENGFIEHFQITSAKETKKGSNHVRNESEYDRRFQEKVSDISSDIGHFHETHQLVEHSHQFLLDSLFKNYKNHLESLKKYSENYDVSIFMIQYTDSALEVKNVDDKELTHRSGFTPYYPHLDKEMLTMIQRLSEQIDYVVFVFQSKGIMAYPYDATFEVFAVKNIESVISKIIDKQFDIVQIEGMSVSQEINEFWLS